MPFTAITDPSEFARRAERLLSSDRTRHNVLLGVLTSLLYEPGRYPSHNLWLVEDSAGPAAAAVQTPPHKALIAKPRDPTSLAELATGMHMADPDVPGVGGAEPEAGTFAELWSGLSDRRAQRRMSLRLHALDAVERLPVAAGRMRYAAEPDRALIIDWWQAFEQEAHVDGFADLLDRTIDARLSHDPPGFCLWEVDGRPVSLAGHTGITEEGVRVGPVYTPPPDRAHGYATSLVAELTRRLLAAGHQRCLLYTDLANPTSNAIYRRIGYLPVCDSAEYEFTA